MPSASITAHSRKLGGRAEGARLLASSSVRVEYYSQPHLGAGTPVIAWVSLRKRKRVLTMLSTIAPMISGPWAAGRCIARKRQRLVLLAAIGLPGKALAPCAPILAVARRACSSAFRRSFTTGQRRPL